MAQMLLHGVVDAKILEADLSVTSDGQLRPTRKTVMKKRVFSWIKKLSFCNNTQRNARLQQLENAIGLGGTAGKLYATVDIDKARVGRTRMRVQVTLAGGKPYQPRRCWEDVFEAITNARRMVYIAGWSVNTDVALVRDPRKPSSGTLGELLKRKAAEGVRVLMLVWDDRTSLGLGPIRRDGLMATHDEDTATYFRGTGVRCILCPRNPDQGRSYVQDVETAAMFTHHQKTVIVDSSRNAAANASPGLVSFLGGIDLCDGSIQDAYIHAIRRARDFIYIENQYFLGSSYAWRRDDGVTVEDINALHLIPKELSLKIVSKIEAGERFAVYVVVPMWPEGVPESGSVQAILDWQRRTMEMMYKDVALAIQAKGIQASPTDYLTFFCLGNREALSPGEYVPPERPDPDTDYDRAQQARRFMIYVHAKTMIVDDEYVIVGSANINQRSMDGGRDSEIAMGAYQPGYLASTNRPARGQAAQQHWDMFASDAPPQGDLPGHLLAYPIGVSDGGELLETTAFFPDTKARVLGNKSTYLPPILTT
uniref:phospholipase D n=1 Tax=Aegilops tauschii TaxID=37682 RepID=M8CY88_AEGTA